jgi:hypothetical protein
VVPVHRTVRERRLGFVQDLKGHEHGQ